MFCKNTLETSHPSQIPCFRYTCLNESHIQHIKLMISFLIGRWCGGSGGNILGPQHIDLTLDEMLLYTLSLSLSLSLRSFTTIWTSDLQAKGQFIWMHRFKELCGKNWNVSGL